MSNEQQQQTTQSVEVIKQDISTQVLAKVKVFEQSGALKLPDDYSPENALKSAYLVLTDPKTNLLTKCTKTSVANALLKMVVWGLSPLKTQCYFIPYQDKKTNTTTLECQVSYTGNVVTAKRYGNLNDIKANVIYKGDDFEFAIDSFGRREIIHHRQTLDSIGGEIIGAYAVYILNDGNTDMEIMTWQQIQMAWSQGYDSPAKKKFPEEMAKKTVINRACKMLIRSSDDSVLGTDDTEETDADYIEVEHTTMANQGEVIDLGFEEVDEPNPATTTTSSPETQEEAVGDDMSQDSGDNGSVPF